MLNSPDWGECECSEAGMRFPVTCPLCARESLVKFSIGLITEALIAGSTIRLHANCHNVYWNANELEVEQIREYLGAVRLAADSQDT
jgi:hypothetical protein